MVTVQEFLGCRAFTWLGQGGWKRPDAEAMGLTSLMEDQRIQALSESTVRASNEEVV